MVKHQAIVVGVVPFGEKDKIIKLLTPSSGLISVFAKGARGSKNRFQGLDIGNQISVFMQEGNQELFKLNESELVEARLCIRNNLISMSLMVYGCEFISLFVGSEQPSEAFFGLLQVFLTILEGTETAPLSMFRTSMEIKALTFAGFKPALKFCAVCGRSVENPYFSHEHGGLIHIECAKGFCVSRNLLETIEEARTTKMIELVDRDLPEYPWILADYAEYHLGYGIKSRHFLKSLG